MDVSTQDGSDAVVTLTVTDSGAGLSKDSIGRLFQEGVQINPNKLQKGGGSGFGLFITKGIVKLHGGSIWVESEGEGHGTTFFVQLPLSKGAPTSPGTASVDGDAGHDLEAATATMLAPRVSMSASTFPSMRDDVKAAAQVLRILIVDDRYGLLDDASSTYIHYSYPISSTHIHSHPRTPLPAL